MKIQKVSENQIKFFLTNEDLKEREIRITELAHGSEKARIFFREIMEEAMIDCGFDVGTNPLIVEAMSITADTVMIIVSKVPKEGELSEDMSLEPKTMSERKFKQDGIKIINNIVPQKVNDVDAKDTGDKNTENEDTQDCICIYSFDKMQTVSNLALRLDKIYNGKNILYKYQGRYFLLIQKKLSFSDDLDTILLEYGQRHTSNIICKYHLEEHGEVIIKENALSVLASI